jgi:hypothetical protein
MKTYAHLRQDHSQMMAKKVSFGTQAATQSPSSPAMPVEKVIHVAGVDENASKSLVPPQESPVN